MKYSDEQRIAKIQETTEKLLNYIRCENITPEQILHEEPIQWAITTPLYNIGEHVANLTPEFKNRHSSIPYEDTNWTVICAIIYDVLPKFLEELKQL